MKWADVPSAMALATAPAAEPILFAAAKTFLGLQDSAEQTYVEALITAARMKVETDTGRKLITQAWDLYADRFPEDAIVVPSAPLASVTSIKATSTAGVQSTIATSVYQVDTASTPPRILLADSQSWPGDLRAYQAVVVRLSLGYGASGSYVPSPLLRAMEQLLAHWWRYQVAPTSPLLPKWFGYDALIAPYCLPAFG